MLDTTPETLSRAQAGIAQAPRATEGLPSAAEGSTSLWWLMLVGVVTTALCSPFLRAVFWLGDEGVVLHGAERILQGSRLYADFFEFLPPGSFVLTTGWFGIAGISVLSARSLAILIIVGIACFTYLACLRASKNAPLSVLFTIGWVVMSQGPWTVISHHWFTTLFSMLAAWTALIGVEDQRNRLRWPLIAGLAGGTAAMVTSTRGALAIMAVLIAFFQPRQRPAGLITYLVSCALVPLGLVAYLLWAEALLPAFDDVIRFPAERYALIQSVPFGAGGGKNPLTYVFPAGALLTVLVSFRDWRTSWQDRRFQLCFALGVAGLVGCFPRPDIGHIAFAAPFGLPLLLFCMLKLSKSWRQVYRYGALAIMIAIAIPSARWFLWASYQASRAELVPTQRGTIAVVGLLTRLTGLPELLERIAATPRDDAYFFYPYMPMMPFLTGRKHVSPYDIFMPGYTLPSQYQDACLAVMRKASWIVIDRSWTDPNTLKAIFPATRDARAPEKVRFEQAIESGFELVFQDGTFELRHRLGTGVTERLCAAIAG